MLKLLLVLTTFAFAHEGHDHGPGAVAAPKGGVMRSLETVHLEWLVKGKQVFIYTYDENMKAVDPAKYPVSLTAELPRKKPVPVTLTPKGDHWETAFDAKGAHRYTLEMTIEQGGHKDKVKFTVEPRK